MPEFERGCHFGAQLLIFRALSLVPCPWPAYRPRLEGPLLVIVIAAADLSGTIFWSGIEVGMATAAFGDSEKLAKVRAAVGADYTPDDDEPYMSERQLNYFRMLLLEWKRSIHTAAETTLQSLQDGPLREADLNDRASSESDWGIELRTRDRQRKLIAKIDAALRRIDGGEYGYCEVTGDPIGLKRLIARPVATMTVEAQEAHERREKISRDD